MNDTLIFEPQNRRERPVKQLQKSDFDKLMSNDRLSYVLFKPGEIRLKFTEFVMMNQPLALDEAAASLL